MSSPGPATSEASLVDWMSSTTMYRTRDFSVQQAGGHHQDDRRRRGESIASGGYVNVLELQVLSATSRIPDGRHALSPSSGLASATRRLAAEQPKLEARR
jgi:hypothetical protein